MNKCHLTDDELVKEVQQTMSFYQHVQMDMTLKLLVHAENLVVPVN